MSTLPDSADVLGELMDIPVPDDYPTSRLHFKRFLRQRWWLATLTILALVASIAILLTPSTNKYVLSGGSLLLAAVGAFFVYRAYWIWANDTYSCAAKNAMVTITHGQNLWLWRKGSSDDSIDLSRVTKIITERTWAEAVFSRWFGKSETLILIEQDHVITIRDFVEPHLIKLIKDYLAKLDALNRDQNRRMIALSEAGLQEERTTNALAKQLLEEQQTTNELLRAVLHELRGSQLPKRVPVLTSHLPNADMEDTSETPPIQN